MPDLSDAEFLAQLQGGTNAPVVVQPTTTTASSGTMSDADFIAQLKAPMQPMVQTPVAQVPVTPAVSQSPPTNTDNANVAPLPFTTTELDQMGIPANPEPDPVAKELTRQKDEAFQQANADPNVPLDQWSGADALTRARLGIHRSKMEQLDILRKLYGESKVRVSKEGDFIVRTTDDNGKVKDLVVDETNPSAKDFLDVLHEAPALALSMTLGTKGVPVGAILRGAVQGATTYAAGGAVTDVLARMFEGEPVQPGEVAAERGVEAAKNTAFGYGAGKVIDAGLGLVRMARGAASQLADNTQGAAMAEINAARGRVAERTGVEFQPTIGEVTGNPMVTRLEAFLSNIPVARNLILKNWRRTVENEKAVMEALGAKDVPDLGERVLNLVQGEGEQAKAAVSQAATAVRGEAEKALTGPLSNIPGKPLSSTSFGERMIQRGEAQLQSFKGRATELYDKVKAIPEASQPLFNAKPIQNRAVLLQDELVKEAGGDVATALAPTGITKVLEQIDALPSKQSYFDLVKLRDAIYDKIGSPEPISDKGTRLLKDLGASITREMQSQGPFLLGPSKWPLVEEANKFYRENVESFYQKGIAGLLKPRTEAGAIDPEKIASNLLAGGKGSVTAYNTFQDFFEKSGAVKDMNRLLRDKVIEAGTDETTGLVNLASLSGAVNKMEPEIVQKLFGTPKDKLMEAVQQGQLALKVTGKGGALPQAGTQASVEAQALQDLLDSGKITSQSIRKLADATLTAKEQYANAIRQAVAKNDMGVIQAAPETFAHDYLFNPATKAADVKDVMQSIYQSGDSELVGDVRRAYLSEIFKDSAKVTKDPTQLVARIKGSPLQELDPQALSLKLIDAPNRSRMEAILGQEGFNDLKDFALAISGRSTRDLAGTTTGAFHGGKLFASILNGDILALPEIGQYALLSYVVTSPKVMQTIKTVANIAPQNLDKVLKVVVLTPEFYRAVSSDSTSPEEARKIITTTQQWAKQPTKP